MSLKFLSVSFLLIVILGACQTSSSLTQSYLKAPTTAVVHTGKVSTEPKVFGQVSTSIGKENTALETIPRRGANYRVFETQNILSLGYIAPRNENREIGFWISVAQGAPNLTKDVNVEFSQKNPIFLGFNVYQQLWTSDKNLQFGLSGILQYTGNFTFIQQIRAEQGIQRANGVMLSTQPVVRSPLLGKTSVFASPSLGIHLGPYTVYNYGWNAGVDIPLKYFNVSVGARQNFDMASENTGIQAAINQLGHPVQIFLSFH